MSGTMKELEKDFDELLERFEKERRELVEDAGEKMYKTVVRNIQRDTEKNTGNLLDGCELHYGSGGGYTATRNNHLKAPHAHLLEYGHKTRTSKNPEENKKRKRPRKDWVDGKFMYRNALNELEGELEQTAEDMIDKIVGEIF